MLGAAFGLSKAAVALMIIRRGSLCSSFYADCYCSWRCLQDRPLSGGCRFEAGVTLADAFLYTPAKRFDGAGYRAENNIFALNLRAGKMVPALFNKYRRIC